VIKKIVMGCGVLMNLKLDQIREESWYSWVQKREFWTSIWYAAWRHVAWRHAMSGVEAKSVVEICWLRGRSFW